MQALPCPSAAELAKHFAGSAPPGAPPVRHAAAAGGGEAGARAREGETHAADLRCVFAGGAPLSNGSL